MQYDDIIIGAGSSGAVVAARLSEDPNRSVLLFEAGPDYRTVEETPHDLLRTMLSLANHDWGWTARATPRREIPLAVRPKAACRAFGYRHLSNRLPPQSRY